MTSDRYSEGGICELWLLDQPFSVTIGVIIVFLWSIYIPTTTTTTTAVENCEEK